MAFARRSKQNDLDNLTYIVAGAMSADVAGASIDVGQLGRLVLSVKWTNTGTPIGTLVLQAQDLIDGTWRDIPGSSGGFGQHPNNDTAGTVGYFRELQAFSTVRVFYRRTSGGTANTSLTAASRVI